MDGDVLAMRREKDDFFKRSPHSPIEDRASFRGLRYYPPDPALRVPATFEPAREPRRIVMATSTGDDKEYLDAGLLRFTLDGKDLTLRGYLSEARPDELFVPFRDATSGTETYGAGRYLEVPLPVREIDLNFAYNPFCAYSEAYSCPLPPPENWLKVPVRAGEMTFT